MAVVEPLHSRYAALAKAPEIVPTTEIPKKIPDPHGFLTDPQDHLRGDTPWRAVQREMSKGDREEVRSREYSVRAYSVVASA